MTARLAVVMSGFPRTSETFAIGELAALAEAKPAPWLLTRAEAAICEARGDPQGAAAKLDEVEQAVRGLPDPTQRDAILRGLTRWKSELQTA